MAKTHDSPRPFLKWAGGKGDLLGELVPRIPERWLAEAGRYHEPFVGAGALFFELHHQYGPLQGVLSDANPELMDCWYEVITRPELLMENLDAWATDEATFYRVRAMKPWKIEDRSLRASRTIYLNKCGYNGLYRLGPDFMEPDHLAFNNPWGKRTKVTLYERENIFAVQRATAGMQLQHKDFYQVSSFALEGDLVYFDPPYVPLRRGRRKSFTAYTGQDFTMDDHERLAQLFEHLVGRGVFCMLSNLSTPWVRDRFKRFRVDEIDAPRTISSDGNREPVREVIIVGEPKRKGG